MNASRWNLYGRELFAWKLFGSRNFLDLRFLNVMVGNIMTRNKDQVRSWNMNIVQLENTFMELSKGFNAGYYQIFVIFFKLMNRSGIARLNYGELLR